MQGGGVAGNCLHPPIAKTKHGLARALPLFSAIPLMGFLHSFYIYSKYI